MAGMVSSGWEGWEGWEGVLALIYLRKQFPGHVYSNPYVLSSWLKLFGIKH
jgi:hypothetical protein